MNSHFDSLDEFAAKLKTLRPSRPNAQLAHRLEMALHQADEEIAQPTNIIYHPFVQWSIAAAAMFVALIMAFQSTRVEPVQDGQQIAQAEQAEALPIYQLVNGRMVAVPANQTMKQAAYKGVQVIDGRAYRHFQTDRGMVYQIIFHKKENDINPAAKEAPSVR